MADNDSFPEAQRDDELFDVVDESDVVLRQATRAEVHAQRLRHRAVHAWVFNAAGQVFLQKRSRLKDMAPGRWDSSCSGHLDAGEDYDTAIVRELGEEIGLAVAAVPERLFYERARAETGQEFVWVYRLEAEGPFTLHPAEIETGSWYELAVVDTGLREQPADFAPAFAYLWQKWRGGRGC